MQLWAPRLTPDLLQAIWSIDRFIALFHYFELSQLTTLEKSQNIIISSKSVKPIRAALMLSSKSIELSHSPIFALSVINENMLRSVNQLIAIIMSVSPEKDRKMIKSSVVLMTCAEWTITLLFAFPWLDYTSSAVVSCDAFTRTQLSSLEKQMMDLCKMTSALSGQLDIVSQSRSWACFYFHRFVEKLENLLVPWI